MQSPLSITPEIEQLRQELRQRVEQQDSDYHECWSRIKEDLLADFSLVPMTLKELLNFSYDPYGCCCVGPSLLSRKYVLDELICLNIYLLSKLLKQNHLISLA